MQWSEARRVGVDASEVSSQVVLGFGGECASVDADLSQLRRRKDADELELMKKQPLDFIQVDYSLANRAAADEVLPTALERRIAVLINLPFGGRRDGNLFSRVAGAELPEWAGEIGAKSWSQVFLKYVVSHPAVTAAIPGMTRLAPFLAVHRT